jgi:hypothetical protein|tara:strand:- start:782 stop:1222 length:441 start_codon:yes stop_codon:yes gene_type:complete
LNADDLISFESVKVAMRQDKNGHVLVLSIHPDEVPFELFNDRLGSRYYCALSKINPDTEQPVTQLTREEEEKGRSYITKSGMVCREPGFQKHLQFLGYPSATTEAGAAEALRSYLKIESRSDLSTNTEAQEKFTKLLEDFESSIPF